MGNQRWACAGCGAAPEAPDPPGPGESEVDLPQDDEVPTALSEEDDQMPGGLRVPFEHRLPPPITCGGAEDDCTAWVHRLRDGRGDGGTTFTLVVPERGLVVVHEHTRLVALDLDVGGIAWEHPGDAERSPFWRRAWSVDDLGVLLVGTEESGDGAPTWRLRAHRLDDGELLWETDEGWMVEDAWPHDGRLRVHGHELDDRGWRTVVHTLDPATGEALAEAEPVDRAVGDDDGEVVLHDGTLSYRPAADGDPWQVAADTYHRVVLDRDHVFVRGWEGEASSAAWLDRASGAELGRWHEGEPNDPGEIVTVPTLALTSGEAMRPGEGLDDQAQAVVSRYGETVVVDDRADGASLTLGSGVLIRVVPSDDQRTATVEVVNLETGRTRTLDVEVRLDGENVVGLRLLDPVSLLVETGPGQVLVDLKTDRIVWRGDRPLSPAAVEGWPGGTTARDVLVWPGGVLRVSPDRS